MMMREKPSEILKTHPSPKPQTGTRQAETLTWIYKAELELNPRYEEDTLLKPFPTNTSLSKVKWPADSNRMVPCLQDGPSLDQWFSALVGFILASSGEFTRITMPGPASEILTNSLGWWQVYIIFLKLPR